MSTPIRWEHTGDEHTDALAEINATFEGLAGSKCTFAEELYEAGRESGKPFGDIAAAAANFAQLGLSSEETVKRTRDALTLVRITGLSMDVAIATLGATVEHFSGKPEHLSFKCPTGRAGDAQVRLSTGGILGNVQAVTYSLRAGEVARCTVETILDGAELTALTRDTTVRVVLHKHPIRTLWSYYTGKLRYLFRI